MSSLGLFHRSLSSCVRPSTCVQWLAFFVVHHIIFLILVVVQAVFLSNVVVGGCGRRRGGPLGLSGTASHVNAERLFSRLKISLSSFLFTILCLCYVGKNKTTWFGGGLGEIPTFLA